MHISTPPPLGGSASAYSASATPDPTPFAATADPAALDLHKGIRTSRLPDPREHGCQRWPEDFRILNETTGELVPGRCRATNLCRYCAKLFAVETSEMLLLDAMEDAPTLYVVLTAREHLTRADCTVHLRHLRRKLKARWSHVRWATTVEFQRRGALHLNLLVKGVDRDDLDDFHAAITREWCKRVDATEAAQWSDVMADAVGVVQYVSLHFMKSSQAPALGWRGHRYSSTRDYLVRPAAQLREEARQSLRLKRLLHRGLDLEHALQELAAANATTWSLRFVNPACPPRPPQTNRTGVPDLAPNARPIAAGQALPPHGGSLAGRSGVES